MQSFTSRTPAVLRRTKPAITIATRYAHHSTPAVPDQVHFQETHEQGYFDLMEYTAAQNQFGEYFKECLLKEGIEWQTIETATYQNTLDEREFDPPAGPRPDSPAWAYMYGNNLVDWKAQMNNLDANNEYKRGMYKHRTEALEKKLRMHYPNLDWEARYESRLHQWKGDLSMSTFSKRKAEALAKAVAADPKAYVDLYRANNHFDFGSDDPYRYYMPKSNEDKWVALQRFEWDQTSRNADVAPYVAALGNLEAMLEPKVKGLDVKGALKAALTGSDAAEWLAAFDKAVPSATRMGAEGLDLLEMTDATKTANAIKSMDGPSNAQLIIALAWGNMPDMFAQFFVSGTFDDFVKDNDAVVGEIGTNFVALAKSSADLDKAVSEACASVEKACGVKGVADFLNGSGLAAAASEACPTMQDCGLTKNLKAQAASLKSQGSFLGWVNCMAAAGTVQSENPAMNLYNATLFGSRGSTLNRLGQADGNLLGAAVGRQVAAFSGNPDDAATAAKAFDLKNATQGFNTSRTVYNDSFTQLKLDYALADMGSLEIQYKY